MQQGYRKEDSIRLDTVLSSGTRVQMTLNSPGKGIKPSRQKAGISPNWVHSMDATHLRMYCRLTEDNGIRFRGLVHDSFATLAADAEMSAACIRVSFVELYENREPLLNFLRDVLPPGEDIKTWQQPPEKGDLDLTEVLRSDYFFG